MFDIDRWNEIWHALAKNKMRSILTAFGVFWGIFMLVAMAGAGNGLKNGVVEGVAKFANNSAFFWTQPTGEPYKGLRRGRNWQMRAEDMEYLIRNVPEIQYITPRNFGYSAQTGPNVVRGLQTSSNTVMGDYPEYVKIDPYNVLQGRWINQIDIINRRKVCVIGENVYQTLFKPGEDPIGEYLRISGVYYQVVGVVRPETTINIGSRVEESIYIPFTTMLQTYNMGNALHFLAITAKPGVPVSVVEEKVKDIIKSRNSIAPNDQQALRSVNIETQFKAISGLFIGIGVLTWIVGIGTLLAGVIGVSNIMLVVVRERTREIGIQRALGAKPFNIISQIMLESVSLTLVAGVIGLSLGVGLLELISRAMAGQTGNDVFFRNPEISFTMAVAALIVLLLAGLFAGSIPAKRAISIKPIDAIRDEG